MNNWEEKYQKLVSSGFSDAAIDVVLAEQNKKWEEKAKKAEKHLIELHNVDMAKTNVSARENIRKDKTQTQKRLEEIKEKIEYNKEHIEDRRRVLKDNCKKIANVLEFRKRLETEKEDILKQILEIQSNKKVLTEKKKIDVKKAKLEAKVAELKTKAEEIKGKIETETDPKKKVQLHRELTVTNNELNKNDNELLRTNMYLKSKSEEFAKIEKDNAEKSKEERRLKNRFQQISNIIAKCDFACSNLMDGKTFDDISLSLDNWKNQKFTYKKVDKEQDKGQGQGKPKTDSEGKPPKGDKGGNELTDEEKERQEKINKVKEDIERLKKDQEKYKKPIAVEKKGIMKWPLIGRLATKIIESRKNKEAKKELENYEGYIAKKEKELKELEKAQAAAKKNTGLITEKTTSEELSKMPVEELAKISASEFNKMQADELFKFTGSDKYKEVMKYKQEKAAEAAGSKPKEEPKHEPETKESGRESFQRKLRQMSSYQNEVNKMGSDYLRQVAEKGQEGQYQIDKKIYEKIKQSKINRKNRQLRKEGKDEIGADAAMKRQDEKFKGNYSERSGDRDMER